MGMNANNFRKDVGMRLRLNLCDVEVQLKINDWHRSETNEDWDDNWCDVELSLNSNYINYDPSGEILMSAEVMHLKKILAKLLDGTLTEDCEVGFAEPDMEFQLRVAKRLYDIPGKVTYRNGYVDVDIDADFVIHFWCADGLGANIFSMNMDRTEINALHTYLKYVIGEIGADDIEISKLVESGMILQE